jgi:hypothetical protein
VPTARILFHPTMLARHAAEIARSQGGKLERDACGRPFVSPGADPLAEAPPSYKHAGAGVDPSTGLGRLIWALRALGTRPPSKEAPEHVYREGPR